MQTLPLSVFEEYFYHIDRASYPSRVIMKFELSGEVDRNAFQQAASQLTQYHPFLRSKVEKNAFGRLHWKVGPPKAIPVYWTEKDPSEFKPNFVPLNLKSGYTAEMHIAVGQNRWDAYLVMCHAVADGMAVVKVWHDFLLLYERAQNKETPLPNRDPNLLKFRERYGRTFLSRLLSLHKQLFGLGLAIRAHNSKVSLLVPDKSPTDEFGMPENAPHVITHRFDSNEYRSLLSRAKQRQLTLNDLYLGICHHSLRIWRTSRNLGEPTDWIRLSVPVSMKAKNDRKMPTCNTLSIVSFDRKLKSLRNRERVIARVKDEMGLVKRHQLGFAFLNFLTLLRWSPGGIRKRVRKLEPSTTAVLSNMGKIFLRSPLLDRKTGLLKLKKACVENIVSLPPNQPGTHATFLFSVYGNKQCIDFHYDTRALTARDAQELLDLFIKELRVEIKEAQKSCLPKTPLQS